MQVIRGVAALLVVFEHLMPVQMSRFIPQGQIGVSMFFFISGFVMVYSFKEDESGFLFLKKRVKRIYPAYIILSLPLVMYYGIESGSFIYFIHSISLIAFYEWVPFTPEYNFVSRATASPVAWTLYYEMYFYFMFALSKFFFKKRVSVAVLTTLLILIAFCVFNYIYGNNGQLGWGNVSYIGICSNLSLLSFIAGMLFYFVKVQGSDSNKRYFVYLIPFVSWFALKTSDKYFSEVFTNKQIVDLFFSSIPSWVFVSILVKSKACSGLVFCKLHYLGMISFSLYLVHSNFYILKLVMGIENTSLFIQILFFLLTVSISLSLAKFSFEKIEMNAFHSKKGIK